MNILFVTSTRIGDAVLSTGLLGWLVENYPAARFTIACGPLAAPLFEAVPRLDRIIVMHKRTGGLHWLDLWARCTGRFWSLVVDLRGSALAYFLPARRRYVQWAKDDDRHRVQELADLFALASPPGPRLWISDTHEVNASGLLPSAVPVVALGPTANWPAKMWPAERFAALAQRLTAAGGALPGAHVAVLGGPGDAEAAAPVLASIPPERRIDLVGRVDLLTAFACLRRAALFVGNDSGLMHLAAASGTATVGLFGPSPVERYRPWGTRTAVVHTRETYNELITSPGFNPGTSGSLMESISIDMVEKTSRDLLQSAGPQITKSAVAGT